MSAAEALKAARAAGVELRVDGDDLVLEAAAPPPAVCSTCCRVTSRRRRAAAAGQRRLVGRGLAGLLRRAGRHRRVRRRAAARRSRGPRLRLLRRRMAEPQSGALAAGTLLSAAVGESTRMICCCRLASNAPAMPGCTRCWAAWYEHGKAEAIARLAAMGIAAPSEFPNDFGKNGGA